MSTPKTPPPTTNEMVIADDVTAIGFSLDVEPPESDLAAPVEGAITAEGKNTVPRVVLLQSNSKPIAEEKPGATAGNFYLPGDSRPISFSIDHMLLGKLIASKSALFVPVRVSDARRLWTPIDAGGGLICEANDAKHSSGGGLVAKGRITQSGVVQFDEGVPTSNCAACVHGPKYADALGYPSKSGWLPETVKVGDKSVKLEKKQRIPPCADNIDIFGLWIVPASGEHPISVVPAMYTVSSTGMPAGREFVQVLKMASKTAAPWAYMYMVQSTLKIEGAQRWHQPNFRQFSRTPAALVKMAAELFENTKDTPVVSVFDDPHASNTRLSQTNDGPVRSDDDDSQAAAADSQF